MFLPNHHMRSTWISSRPDLTLAQILHATATGGVRSDCDTRLLEMHIITKSISVSEIVFRVPEIVHSAPLPERRGNEGIEHRQLRRLGLILAQAIDPQSFVIEEHRVGCGTSHAVIDVWAETRFGRIGFECGTRDSRDIPRLLKANLDHVIVLPFAGWHDGKFIAIGFANCHSRHLPRISYASMASAVEMLHPELTCSIQ
jgi:hypothetical protein